MLRRAAGAAAGYAVASSSASFSAARWNAGRAVARAMYASITGVFGTSPNWVVQRSAVPHSTSAALKRSPATWAPTSKWNSCISVAARPPFSITPNCAN